jgi:hypothetical protein
MALPTQQKFIDNAEQSLGSAFPSWLKTRLLRENGGEIEAGGEIWQLFSVLDTSDRKHASRSATNIVTETKNANKWVGFPENAVAIADNGTGDLLILLSGEVYHWLHESGTTHPVTVQPNMCFNPDGFAAD